MLWSRYQTLMTEFCDLRWRLYRKRRWACPRRTSVSKKDCNRQKMWMTQGKDAQVFCCWLLVWISQASKFDNSDTTLTMIECWMGGRGWLANMLVCKSSSQSWAAGFNRVKGHLSVFPSQHLYSFVSVCIMFACTVCTEIIIHTLDHSLFIPSHSLHCQ